MSQRKLWGLGIAVSGMLFYGPFAKAAPVLPEDAPVASPPGDAPTDVAPGVPVPAAAAGAGTVLLAPERVVAVPQVRGDVRVIFRNDVGSRFRLVGARFTLDGFELPIVLSDARRGQEYVIHTGQMTAGRHMLTGRMRFQGRSRAIFTYLRGYSLDLDARRAVYGVSGTPTDIRIVTRDHKGVNVPFEKSVAVAFEERVPTIAEERAPDPVRDLH